MQQVENAGDAQANFAGGWAGCRLQIDREEVESTNHRMLSSSEKVRAKKFIIPAKQPIELLFFRKLFTQLRTQMNLGDGDDGSEENIPIKAFQRVFGRLFNLLGDENGFDAKVYDENGNGFVGWGEFCYVFKERNITINLSLPERIYLTFDDSESSILAGIVAALILLTIVVSSCCFVLSTVPECQIDIGDGSKPVPMEIFAKIELVCLAVFILEYLSRIFTVWGVRQEIFNKPLLIELTCGFSPIKMPDAFQRLAKFVVNPANVIDLLAILPAVISLFIEADGGAFVVLRLIRLTRIFRAFKNPKLQEPVIVLSRTMQQSRKALEVLVFFLLLGVVIFASLMWIAEGGEYDVRTRTFQRYSGRSWDPDVGEYIRHTEASPFESIPHTFWWAIVTATTVGYGDHFAKTSLGYVVTVLTMMFSLVVLALPVGVIGGTFSQVWEDFALERQRDQEALRQEMVFIAAAVRKIDPCRMRKLLLVEVWNDTPTNEPPGPTDIDGGGITQNESANTFCGKGNQAARPTPAEFMGEVKIELDLPRFQSQTKELTLSLKENHATVERRVTGIITVKYEWTPSMKQGDSGEDAVEPLSEIPVSKSSSRSVLSRTLTRLFTGKSQQGEVPEDMELDGQLKVTLIAADGLLNLDWSRKHGASSPYCILLCYPTSPSPDHEDTLWPAIWRAPTIKCTLRPRWNVSHTFDYAWTKSKSDGKDTGGTTSPSAKSDRGVTGNSPTTSPRAPTLSVDTESKVNELLSSLQNLSVELKVAREEIKELTGQVDWVADLRRD